MSACNSTVVARYFSLFLGSYIITQTLHITVNPALRRVLGARESGTFGSTSLGDANQAYLSYFEISLTTPFMHTRIELLVPGKSKIVTAVSDNHVPSATYCQLRHEIKSVGKRYAGFVRLRTLLQRQADGH